MTNEQIRSMMDESGRIGGSLDLSGTQITALPEGLQVGGSLDLSGTQWESISEDNFRKFAAPWFKESLDTEEIGDCVGWCTSGIQEAMGILGFDDDADEYTRADVRAALLKNSAALRDNDRTSVALVILNRVASLI